MKNLLFLATCNYNLRPHTSNNNESPFKTFNDSHVSSEVARFRSGQMKDRRTDFQRIFSRRYDYTIGDLVIAQEKPHPFRRESIFYPRFEKTIYQIQSIDKNDIPPIYVLASKQNPNIQKKLYGFQMRKVAAETDPLTRVPLTSSTTEGKITVIDVILKDPTLLRSNFLIPGKEIVSYRVQVGQERQILSTKGLKLLIKSLNNETVQWSSFFNKPEHMKYILS